jgi:hypothetical protein
MTLMEAQEGRGALRRLEETIRKMYRLLKKP